MGPREALSHHKTVLQQRHDYSEEMRADAAIWPKKKTVYNMFDSWRRNKYGDQQGESVIKLLAKKKEEYEKNGGFLSFATKKESVSGQEELVAVAMITPLMKRVHELSTSSEICFIDTTSCCDATNKAITFILTATTFGALPLAVIFTDGQSEYAYETGFQLVKNLIGDIGFGRKLYPSLIMTDDSSAERNALAKVWPKSKLYLCQFHVAQALWRWLWNSANGIKLEDRKPLMLQFRSIMYANMISTAMNLFEDGLRSVTAKYPKYAKYLTDKWERKKEWATAWRCEDHRFRGHHTNNYCEAAVGIFKDIVLERCKVHNVVALIEFVSGSMEDYYKDRLLDYAHRRISKPFHMLEKHFRKASYIQSADEISKLPDGIYEVPSSAGDGLRYWVDVRIGICTCDHGNTGRFCKHQAAVIKYFSEATPNQPNVNTYEAASLALGDEVSQPEFYTCLHHRFEIEQHHGDQIQNESAEGIEIASEVGNNENESRSVSGDDDANNSRQIELENVLAVVVSKLKFNVEKFGEDPNVLQGLQMFSARMDKAKNASAFSSLLCSMNNSVPLRFRTGAQIGTQPTSRSRRALTSGRGVRRLQSGRKPSSHPSKAPKRPHALLTNVNNDEPNGK